MIRSGKTSGSIVVWILLVLFDVSYEKSFNKSQQKWSKLAKSDSFTDYVAKMNYSAETIHVTTEDNYVLGIHRLKQDNPKKVVLIQHGLLSSSVDWVLIGRNKSLALILHDMGYDVWLGNARGNAYSRSHLNFSTGSKAYWDFSWHEIGYYDLPAVVDTILEITQVQRLDYIGHSQGLTTFLLMTALRPEYQKYFRTIIGLSPIAFLGNLPSNYMRILASNADKLKVILDTLKIYEVTPSNGIRATLSKVLCKETSPAHDLCANILFLTVGPGPVYLNRTILPDIFHNIHAGVSTRQMIHFANLINSGRFQHYDYKEQNMAIYNTAVPPDYPLQVIRGLDLRLFYGTKDTLMAKRDVERLADYLRYSNTVQVTQIRDFNHVDYIFGSNVTEILYRPVIDIMLNNAQESEEDEEWL